MNDFNKWFLDPVTNQYVDFDGRATREQYWMFTLWTFIIAIAVGIISTIFDLGNVPGNALSLVLLLPHIAFGARRLHDIGKSGWWQLLNLIPIIGWIIVLIWLIRQGETGPNQYGVDPRAPLPVSETVTPQTASTDSNIE